MTVYLLHFHPKLKHAKHYIGWTKDEDAIRRSLEHKNGTQKASPLIRAALAAGCVVKLACVWPGADRKFERKLKNRKNAWKFCPCCNGKTKIIYQPKETINEGKDKTETTEACAIRPGAAVSRVPTI